MNITEYNFINLNFNVETRNKVSSRGSQTASQLAKLHLLQFRHSGLDPWFDRPFDRLTVLSKVEGESSAVSRLYVSGCPRIAMRDRLLTAGMTAEFKWFFELRHNLFGSTTQATGTDPPGATYIIDGIELIVVRNEDFF